MLKVLLKKQLLELNRNFFYDPKKGRVRSKASSIAFIALYAFVMLFVMGTIFVAMAVSLCGPLHEKSLDWLYFALFGIIAVALGLFGSVFNTFASLYQAKDNDLLLSLPVPVRIVLVVRLAGVYLMGLMFSALVLLPGIVVYIVTVGLGAGIIIGGLLLMLTVSLIVLVLSCALGWVVAKINARLKNKSFITVIVSLAFIAGYYYVYFNAYSLLNNMLANIDTVSQTIRGSVYPLYLLGRMGIGDPLATLVVLVATALLLALVWWILARSFYRLATTPGNASKTVYRERAAVLRSQSAALLAREAGHLKSSPTYMLNCCLGSFMMVVVAVAACFKGTWLIGVLNSAFGDAAGLPGVLICGGICMLASTNIVSAPSVSLEGRSLWLAQSLPVSAWQCLRAKLWLHVLVTGIPALICSVFGVVLAWNGDIIEAVAAILLPQAFVVFGAELGLAINLKRPNLTWSNEAMVVKQSLGVLVTMLVGWIYTILLVVLGIVMADFSGYYLAGFTVLTSAIALLIHRWIRRRGSEIFAAL